MVTKFLVVNADGEFHLESPNAQGEMYGSFQRMAEAQAVIKVTVDESINVSIEPVKLRGQLFIED